MLSVGNLAPKHYSNYKEMGRISYPVLKTLETRERERYVGHSRPLKSGFNMLTRPQIIGKALAGIIIQFLSEQSGWLAGDTTLRGGW